MAYTVTVDGIDITNKLVDEGFTVTQIEMGVRRCRIKLYEQLYSLGDELKVTVNGKMIFQGETDKEIIRMDEFTALASDKLIQLAFKNARTAGHYEYENEDYTDILKDLLNYYFSGVFDVTNVDDTGKTCEHINLKDKQISECVQELALRSQFVLWLEPPNILYFKAKDTVSSGHSAILGTDIKDLQVTRDTYTKTKVIIRMKLGDIVRGTGERIIVLADDTITTEAEANDLADAILDELQDTQIQGEITLDDVRHDIYAGTTMVLHAPRFGFDNQTIRIKQVVFSPKSTRLTVGTIAAFTEGAIISLYDRVSRIEARGLRWLSTCESRTQTAAACGTACEIDCEAVCEVPCEPTCEAVCESGDCQGGPCEVMCQTGCQKIAQVTCTLDEQICGTDGVCQIDCQTGHGVCQQTCQLWCQSVCQLGECQTTCKESCQATCQDTCEDACLQSCESGCEPTCNVGCEVDCQTACRTSCKNVCQLSCQATCVDSCQGTCEASCQTPCETSCQTGCLQEQLCCGTIIY